MLFDIQDGNKINYQDLQKLLDEELIRYGSISGVIGDAFKDGKALGKWEGISIIKATLKKEWEKNKKEKEGYND